MIELSKSQLDVINKLKNGSILVGDVGSGKSRTAIAYYFIKECGGVLEPFSPIREPKTLVIITTAKKRDQKEWEEELAPFRIFDNVFVDSWNCISKYEMLRDAVFLFDEQRVIGSGAWVKSFLKIVKNNRWLLLTATPGDNWMDYVPTFIANGFYKNRTEFIRRHVVYKINNRYPVIDRYLEVTRLMRLRSEIVVNMRYIKTTIRHDEIVKVRYDKDLYNTLVNKRWNIYDDQPVKDISELCYLMRKLVNSDESRIKAIKDILQFRVNPKVIIFYNFNFELDSLLWMGRDLDIPTAQWNGHKHEQIPKTDSWIYLVQYSAGAEGWNCIETDTIIFFSQDYSYKRTVQAAGRIDRRNTPFKDLYYYKLISEAPIDMAIKRAWEEKKDFNERRYLGF